VEPDIGTENLFARRRFILAALAIVVAVAAAYSNSFSGPFIFDDIRGIQENKAIRSLRSPEALVPPGNVAVARRPLTNLSFAVNYAIGKLAVRSYHAGNLLIHLLAALTLFGIVRRTLLLPALRDRFGGASTGLAAAVALIWALHPLQTESVTYIVQRAESLMGLCYLLTLYAVIHSASSERPWPWYAAAVAVCALGMGAKEVMVTAPVVALLYDRAFLSGSFRETFRRRGALYLGLAATSAIMLLYKAPAGAGFGIKTVTPWRYALTQPGVILYYLRLSFWPQPLCLDYSWPFATTFREAAPEAFALAALLAATAWAAVRRPTLGFLAAWFFLILAPTSSVMPLNDACFEHRMYLSLAAVAAGTVIAGYALIGRLARQSALPGNSVTLVAVVLALAVAVALGCATFRRNTDYRTAVSIWEDAARKRPANPRAWSNLGEAYVNASRYDEAIRACNRALEREPAANIFESATIYCNRGLASAGLGRLTEAIRDYDQAIALNPDYDRAYNNRGLACAKVGRLTEAIQDYDKAIALNPDYAQAYESRGIAYARSARPADAMRDFDQAIALNPDYAEAYYNRGNARLDANRHSEAIGDYDQAIALKPDYAVAYYNRAVAQYEMKAYDKASTDVKMFMRLGGQPDPGFLEALRQATGPAK
jgi:tetratricopeptide (TPR) repeat protein